MKELTAEVSRQLNSHSMEVEAGEREVAIIDPPRLSSHTHSHTHTLPPSSGQTATGTPSIVVATPVHVESRDQKPLPPPVANKPKRKPGGECCNSGGLTTCTCMQV